MLYNRQTHWQFLEEELQAQTESFMQKLNTSATFLLQDREELFVAQFLKFEDGEMILKFSNKRGIPRKGEYLYCFTVPKELRDFRTWGNLTYGDLVKSKGNFTETVCIWQAPLKDDKDFCLAGFRGVELEFAINIQSATGMILLLGPNKPPYEYIANLQKIVLVNHSKHVNQILDQHFQINDWKPVLLNNKSNISDFVLNQLSLTDNLILQGPPGTGKTFLIAEICEKLCSQGKSVLVTALTNRALIEVADKPALVDILKQHRIFKTKISTDEAKEMPDLLQTKEINPQPGSLILSTFYITSSESSATSEGQQFDFVIVDEASQALLAMFAASNLLGKKNIWIGDTNQLAPVVSLSEDKINKKNYGVLVDGLKTLSAASSIPIYQLTETYRLTNRAADYTGIFYKNSLTAKGRKDIRLLYPEISFDTARLFNPMGGPTLIKTELEIGNKKPSSLIDIVNNIVAHLLTSNEKLHISVLTYFVETTKFLQKSVYQSIGYHKNLLIETVSRVQGLTTDVTIFVIPNTGYNRSLDRRLFNVATSRSKRQTLIIADKNVVGSYSQVDEDVRTFLRKLDDEFSFYVSHPIKMIENRDLYESSDEQLQLSQSNEKIDVSITNIQNDTNEDSKSKIGVKIVGNIDLSKFEKHKKEIRKDKINLYIIDTNVFIDFPEIITKIEKQYPVILSAKVLDELDKLKSTLDNQGKYNVQKALKSINLNIDKRDVRLEIADLTLLPDDFNKKSPDNFILTVALKFKSENPILLTSDNGLQIKSKGLGISTITLKEFIKQSKY